jgi:hypothetical protein
MVKGGKMKRLILTLAILAVLPVAAQVTDLKVTKSGSDVILTWTTGTGPFTIIRSDMPQMTTRTVTLAGAASPYSAQGDKADGARLHCYIVDDSSTTPSVMITTPPPNFVSPVPCICASGTASASAVATYCNTQYTTGTPQNWTACQQGYGVPLPVTADPHQGNAVTVTAACVDGNSNWAYVTVSGTYTGNITDRKTCHQRGQGM